MQYTHIDQQTKKGLVDCIYIDPPYNTGSVSFPYNDKFEKSEWLSMMDIRLKLAKNLLADDGVIFVQIDSGYQAELKLLLDDIFGQNSYVTTLHVEMSATQGMKVKAAQTGTIVKNAEFIHIYSKDGRKNIARTLLYDSRPDYDTHYNKMVDKNGKIVNLKEVYNKTHSEAPIKNYNDYAFNETFHKYVHKHRKSIFCYDKVTGFSPDDIIAGKINKIVRNKKQYHLVNKNGKVKQLLFLSDSYGLCDDFNHTEGLRKIRGDWWSNFYKDMGNVSKEGNVVFSNGKKPVRLIKQLIKLATTSDKEYTILDFYAGSGTTGHAVLELNAEDDGHRHFILCTNNEIYDHKLRQKVAKEIKAAGSAMTEQKAHQLYAEIGVCHHVTYPRLQNIFKVYHDDNLRYMQVKTDIKETGLNDADVRNVIDEFISYVEIKENIYDIVKDNYFYILTNNEKDVLVFSADENDSLISYLKAKQLAIKHFENDGKKHIVYCKTNAETITDGIYYVPYPAQVLNRIKAGKKFVKREEIL